LFWPERDRMRMFRSLLHRPIEFQSDVGIGFVVDRDCGELSWATGPDQSGADEGKNNGADLVHLVYLVCLVYWVYLVSLVERTQPDRPDRHDRPDRQG